MRLSKRKKMRLKKRNKKIKQHRRTRKSKRCGGTRRRRNEKEVVENGEAKEEGELSDNSDAPSPSKAPLKTEVTPTEELDVLFAKEPFVKAATMFSQNNFDTILGQLTAAIEKGNLSVNLYLYCFS